MSALDLLRLALAALSKHRLRTLLSLLGVAIGVAAVVLLTSLGEGARRYVDGQFSSLGTNLLLIFPGKTETTGSIPGMGGAANDLTLADAEAVQRGIPQLLNVVPLVVGNDTVSYRERRRQVVIAGGTHGMLEARRMNVATGQFLPELDFDRGAQVVVLGSTLARELFRDENPLGRVVRVGDARMRVIGVMAARGMQLGMDMDEVAILPVATAMRLFNRSSLFEILLQVGAHSEIETVKERALAILTERHNEEDVTVITQDAVAGALSNILVVLTMAIAGIGAISLTVAGIGIMNVMLVSVSERTSEVGLLRALGARRGQILALFLIEAVLLSSLGGAVGLAVSWGATRALEWRFPAFPVTAPTWAVAAALGVSIAVGAVFGVLPARRASRLDPILALQKR